MDWNLITGLSSVVIAILALFYTVWQGKQAQKHNKLSFRPHIISWSHSDSDQGLYELQLINNGLGPAIIESFTIKIDGKVIAGTGMEPIEKGLKILFPHYKYRSWHSYMGNGYSMAAKDRCLVLKIQFTEPNSLNKEEIEHTLDRASLVVKYKSFYDEEFSFSTENDKS